MEDLSPRRPEELLYRLGHDTRAMDAFFSLEEEEQRAVLARTAHAESAQEAEEKLERELGRLRALGSEYDRQTR